MSNRVFLVLNAIILSLCLPDIVSANVIFEESFEDYALGSDLAGQGGWFGDSINVVNSTTGLGSHVVLGPSGPGISVANTHNLFRDESLDSNKVYTLSFDAFAGLTGAGFVNQAGLGPSSINSISFLVLGWSPNSGQTPGWSFLNISPDVAIERFIFVPGGAGQIVRLEVVLDLPNNEVYGRYDFGSGFQETEHVAPDPLIISVIRGVTLFGGGELDNIVVTETPEPTSLAVFMGLGIAIVYRRRGGGLV